MYIVFSERSLEYWDSGHPESPSRVMRARRMLEEKNFEFVPAQRCSEDDLLLVHSKKLVENIRKGTFFDSDSPSLPGVYEYAKLSAGAAIQAMKYALDGETSFSLMRPPGHHVGINGRALGAPSMGFCYFNNIAIACKKALDQARKIVIVDVDCHHGNGTQEIFRGEPRTLFVSLHKYGNVYPGTGRDSEGNCLNYPFTYDIGDAEYISVLESALGRIEEFDPDLVGVSAGFDAHKNDPLCSLGLSEESYATIGRLISELGKKTFAVLEGGYGQAFPICVYNFLKGLDH